MKSIPGQTEPRVSRKDGEKQRGKQRVTVTLSSTLDNCAQLTPTARGETDKRGEENKSTSENTKAAFSSFEFSF